MFRRGTISTVDKVKKTARVTFDDLDGQVTIMLPLLNHRIKDGKITGTFSTITIHDPVQVISGPAEFEGIVDIDYVPEYKIGDKVAVAFFDNSITDGVILGRIGG